MEEDQNYIFICLTQLSSSLILNCSALRSGTDMVFLSFWWVGTTCVSGQFSPACLPRAFWTRVAHVRPLRLFQNARPGKLRSLLLGRRSASLTTFFTSVTVSLLGSVIAD